MSSGDLPWVNIGNSNWVHFFPSGARPCDHDKPTTVYTVSVKGQKRLVGSIMLGALRTYFIEPGSPPDSPISRIENNSLEYKFTF